MTTADANFRTSGAPGRADFLCFSRFDFGKSRNNKKMQTSLFYQIFLTIFKISNVIGGVIKHRAPPNIHAPTFIRRSAQKKTQSRSNHRLLTVRKTGMSQKKCRFRRQGRRAEGAAPPAPSGPRGLSGPRAAADFFFWRFFAGKHKNANTREKLHHDGAAEKAKNERKRAKKQRKSESRPAQDWPAAGPGHHRAQLTEPWPCLALPGLAWLALAWAQAKQAQAWPAQAWLGMAWAQACPGWLGLGWPGIGLGGLAWLGLDLVLE